MYPGEYLTMKQDQTCLNYWMNESKRESDKDDEEKTKETFDLVKMFVLYTGSR